MTTRASCAAAAGGKGRMQRSRAAKSERTDIEKTDTVVNMRFIPFSLIPSRSEQSDNQIGLGTLIIRYSTKESSKESDGGGKGPIPTTRGLHVQNVMPYTVLYSAHF